jgi:L-alanine-DL-glutamate epimerase-like enolase superfamily enzyme
MSKSTDVRVISARLYLLPVQTRVPLKFGAETMTHVTCARVCLRVRGRDGRESDGWGETPLSVQWGWPGALPYEYRYNRMRLLCEGLTREWAQFEEWGHPIEIGQAFLKTRLPRIVADSQAVPAGDEPMPWLAALICASAFDVALHDAYGNLHGRPVYELYGRDWLSSDLSRFLEPAGDAEVSFRGRYPSDFLLETPATQLPAWHLIGGLDPLEETDLTGAEPSDGYPVLLRDWIHQDGLRWLKVKLRGTDAAWDHERLVRVGRIALSEGIERLSADFNCTVQDPAYVNEILDRLSSEAPAIFNHILYVEQPFPYELEAHPIDVHSVSSRKPLFLDESAHDWELVRLGRRLGWTGVALKTCKTQTGALLTACWGRAHGLSLMVQDLSNPMLALIPHVQLAAHVGTIAGVEVNAMQFYPDASLPEEAVHPGLYRRRAGHLDLATLSGSGFGYRLSEIARALPEPTAVHDS